MNPNVPSDFSHFGQLDRVPAVCIDTRSEGPAFVMQGNNSDAEAFAPHASTNAAYGLNDPTGNWRRRRASSSIFTNASAGDNAGKSAARRVSQLRAHSG
jgi:hypothetical protein